MPLPLTSTSATELSSRSASRSTSSALPVPGSTKVAAQTPHPEIPSMCMDCISRLAYNKDTTTVLDAYRSFVSFIKGSRTQDHSNHGVDGELSTFGVMFKVHSRSMEHPFVVTPPRPLTRLGSRLYPAKRLHHNAQPYSSNADLHIHACQTDCMQEVKNIAVRTRNHTLGP